MEFNLRDVIGLLASAQQKGDSMNVKASDGECFINYKRMNARKAFGEWSQSQNPRPTFEQQQAAWPQFLADAKDEPELGAE